MLTDIDAGADDDTEEVIGDVLERVPGDSFLGALARSTLWHNRRINRLERFEEATVRYLESIDHGLRVMQTIVYDTQKRAVTLEGLEARMAAVEKRLESLESQVAGVGDRLDRILVKLGLG